MQQYNALMSRSHDALSKSNAQAAASYDGDLRAGAPQLSYSPALMKPQHMQGTNGEDASSTLVGSSLAGDPTQAQSTQYKYTLAGPPGA